MPRRLLLLSALLCAVPAWAQPVELAGVRYAPTAQVAGSRLVLNGAGVRQKFVVKLYAAGLYLGSKVGTAEEVLAAPGPKRLQVVLLRDLDTSDLAWMLSRGMQDSAAGEGLGKAVSGSQRLADILAATKKLAAGDSLAVDWVPGVGSLVRVNGKPQGEPVKEAAFFDALIRSWLGPSPADRALKDALLGHQTTSLALNSTNPP